MFVEKIVEFKKQQIKAYPVNSNRASDLGHPCVRYHVLNRTRWQEKKLHDVGLEMIFNMGNEIERIVLREMDDARIKVIEQQKSYSWPEYQITGHGDGNILDEGNIYPFDIKSSSPYVFDSIKSLSDLTNGKYVYLRKYPVQLNLYMAMEKAPKGLFIFKNKVTGRLKEIWMDFDQLLLDETLEKATAINKHVADGTLPDPIDYDDQISGRCPFAHICIPDRIGKEVEISDDAELESLIKHALELEPTAKEYEKLDKEISALVKEKEKLLVGDYLVTGKWVNRAGFTVEPSRYWKKSILFIE